MPLVHLIFFRFGSVVGNDNDDDATLSYGPLLFYSGFTSWLRLRHQVRFILVELRWQQNSHGENSTFVYLKGGSEMKCDLTLAPEGNFSLSVDAR